MSKRYENELVSVIMPCFNSADVIGASIESVLTQTYQNFELFIIDDFSTDRSLEVIAPYLQDSRVMLLAKNENHGVARARNDGLARSSGRYIAFLDSDDLWVPEKLATQLADMRRNKAVLSFAAYETFHERPSNRLKTVRVPRSINYTQLLRNTIIGCLTVVVDRKQTGDFQMPDLAGGEDTATWLNILWQHGTAYGIDKPLAYYRVSGASLSGNKLQMVRRTWRMYRETQRLSIFSTCICFSFYIKNAISKRI
ncbi:glycosyl transferase family 2 [Listeria grandensis FSL F6-0971]|uniref:Glycosyl transferase family 2 n=1 Tax=Listeria grandensis FSL F6-0971 TaxID=1265819 RepID=W7BIU7_9LIST|nr:glycosyltransferase family 2 protein [Listeria grandensis]EUJ23141.1 glycosyl transferase family 2 [Listeria grandensis FSL F6-0971]